MTETYTKIRRFVLNSSTWTAVITPVDCNFVGYLGCDDGSTILRSSDPTNVNAYYPMIGPFGLIAPYTRERSYSTGTRYLVGDTVGYLKALSGNPIANVEFIP